MSESVVAPGGASLLDVLSVLERNLPRAVAQARLGPAERDALSPTPNLLSSLLLSIEKAERVAFLARMHCVSKEVGALLQPVTTGDSSEETSAAPAEHRVTLAEAEALVSIISVLVRSGVLATALEHPPARAQLLLLATSESDLDHKGIPLLTHGNLTADAARPGRGWLRLAARVEVAEATRWTNAQLLSAMAGAFGMELSLSQLPAMCGMAERIAEGLFLPHSDVRLRTVRARAIAEELFTDDALQPWKTEDDEEEEDGE